MSFRVAVVGATGAVGREILKTLAERHFPISEIAAIASGRSAGSQVSFGEDRVLTVKSLEKFDFAGWDIALFSPGASVSAIHAPRAAASGCVVIDNTSQFRMDPEIPLVVPEVNPEAIAKFAKRNIIANPNCSTIQMVVALKPLHDKFKVKRVVVATYQSVSGAGKEGMDELLANTKVHYVHDKNPPQVFQKDIAFNVIPQIDSFMDDGATKEEWKMAVETKKILDPSIAVIATCVRVPVFIGHAEAVHVEFEHPITVNEARAALRNARGVILHDHRVDGGYITPAEAQGEDAVYVSRIRVDHTVPNGLAFWCVSDNLRKGAALNAVQIAEILVAQNLLIKKSCLSMLAGKRWKIDSETGILQDVLLCPPTHYHWIDTNAVAHATLAAGAPADAKRRQAQYHQLECALTSAGVTIHHTVPEPQLPYQVYTRDSSQTTPWGPVLTTLAMPERRGEYASLLNFHAQYDGFYKYTTAGTVEGGDIHIIRPGLLVIGHSGIRTNQAGADQFARFFSEHGWEVKKILFAEHFLHLDVLFCMATPRLAVACIDVLGDPFETFLNDRQIQVIRASYAEVMAMSCNLLSLGNDRVISPQHSTRLNAALRAEGVAVLDPELDEFARGGGSVHCMTMPLLRDPI